MFDRRLYGLHVVSMYLNFVLCHSGRRCHHPAKKIVFKNQIEINWKKQIYQNKYHNISECKIYR